MSIRIRVIIITSAIAIALCLATMLVNIALTQQYMSASTNDDMEVVTGIANEYITSSVNLLKANAEFIAAKLNRLPDSELNEAMGQLTDDDTYFTAISVVDKDGVIDSYGDYPLPTGLRNSKYTKLAFEGDSIISTTRKEKRGNIVFHICVPMSKNRVLAATVDGMFFSNLLKPFKLWNSSHMFMLDDDGTLMASAKDSWVRNRMNFAEMYKTDSSYKGLSEFAEHMTQSKNFTGEFEFAGDTYLGIAKPLTGSHVGWSLGLIAPIDESPLIHVRNSLIFVSSITMAICIILSLVLSRQISLPMETNAQLSELKKEAERASETKSAFLANMSHEMRTPLNAIIGLSELKLNVDGLESDVREGLEKINNSGTILLSIINDLLDISKIESGKFELVDDKYDMPSFVYDTVCLNLMRIKGKPIEFKLDIDPNITNHLYGDELRVKQIFNNLLSNACKYTESGEIEWKLAHEIDGDDVWLISSVRDTGIGIRKEDIKWLFTDYGQVDVKNNRKIEGTGLGLSITKRLVDMMDGEISVESEYGKGSTFAVKIRQKRVDDAVIGAEIADNIKRFNYFEHKRNIGTKLNRINLSYARVLIVDDVATNLDVAKGMMKPYGMTIDCANSGEEAIECIRNGERYNAIFMDHMMPVMDGIEAVRIIREEIDSEYARTVPIIALTANAINGNAEMFLSRGFQAFLSKPVDIMKLDFIVRQWVRDWKYELFHGMQHDDGIQPDDSCQESGYTPEDLLAKSDIPGLDTDSGLARFGGDASIYLDVLSSYAANTKKQLGELADTVRAGDMENCAIVFHGIKGSSRGISAKDIGTKAEALEKAAKSYDRKYVENHTDEFIAKTDALIAAIKEMLRSATAREKKPIKDKPDEGLLKKLAYACETFGMDDADTIVNELEQFDYKNDGVLVTWLREKVDAMDFEEIVAHLSERNK